MSIKKRNITRGVRLKPDDVAFDGIEGEIKVGDTSKELEVYLDSAARTVVTENQTQTLTNKTVVAASNTITTAASGNLSATELNAALSELQSDIDTRALDSALTSHLNDTSDAHDASAVSFSATGSISSTDVQAMGAELDSDIQGHITDSVDAHDASAISVSPSGNLSSTDVQSALVELQGDINTINADLGDDVEGPASSTDNALTRFDGTTGKLLQNSVVTVGDTGTISGVTQLNVDNIRISSNDIISTDTNGNINIIPNGTGDVDIRRDARFRQPVRYDISSDTATGSGTTLTTPASSIVRLTNSGLASISMIPAGEQGQSLILINSTGNAISLLDNAGATAADRILTGNQLNLILNDEASLQLLYDTTEARWMVVSPIAAPIYESAQIKNLGIAATVGSSAMTIAIKTDSGSDASGTDRVSVGFRNATSATGQFTSVDITGALSTVISSGSTAGQSNGVAAYIYVYLINNSGTAEIAWSRSLYDEGSVVSTTAEGGAGAADSAATIYSTTARSNVPLRLVGRLLNTQTTAGTWATAPSEISLVPFNTQLVYARYSTNAGQAVTDGNTVVFEDLSQDTHNAYNTSTGVFTAPIAGLYLINAVLTTQSVTAGAIGQSFAVRFRTSGAIDSYKDVAQTTAASRAFSSIGVAVYRLAQGATMSVEFSENIPAVNLKTDGADNWLMIERIGA